MLLCYITDRVQLGNDEPTRRARLLGKIQAAADARIDYIQLRERDLSAKALEALAREARDRVPANSVTKLLINSRIDVALAAGADGVNLRSDDINAAEARAIFAKSEFQSGKPTISVSCHTAEEAALAEAHGADFAVFAPVFEKASLRKNALEDLRRACERPAAAAERMPMLALGGVTIENATDCLRAGATGIAGIRLFQQNDMASVVAALRALTTSMLKSHRRHPYFES